jgi:hypothetical protein
LRDVPVRGSLSRVPRLLVEVVRRPALSATASDVLEADGYLLGTPANIGYISDVNTKK